MGQLKYLVLAGVVALTGCDYSLERLVEDTQLRREVLKECAEMGLAAKDDAQCRLAAEAEVEAAKRGVKSLLGGK